MEFKKYISSPRIVEAMQFTDETKNQVFNLLTGQISQDFEDGSPIIKVRTLHGDIAIVRSGDWIIKEPVLGYYYPCKQTVFEDTYEALI